MKIPSIVFVILGIGYMIDAVDAAVIILLILWVLNHCKTLLMWWLEKGAHEATSTEGSTIIRPRHTPDQRRKP